MTFGPLSCSFVVLNTSRGWPNGTWDSTVEVTSLEVSVVMGGPNSWMVYKGKS